MGGLYSSFVEALFYHSAVWRSIKNPQNIESIGSFFGLDQELPTEKFIKTPALIDQI